MVKEMWSSRYGVILAVTGSAVGLGNFLRFPGLAAKYDGGVFMIPYFISLLLIGLPLAWVEWSMGRYGGNRGYNSTPGIFRIIWKNKCAPYLGVFGLLIPVVVYMYYVFIESWCLGYAWIYLQKIGQAAPSYSMTPEFFANYIGAHADGSLFHDPWNSTLVFMLICVVANFYLIYRGLSQGIEWFCVRAMPLLVLCAFLVLLRVLTLGTPDPTKPDQNILQGLGFMWNLNLNSGTFWNSLANPRMWIDAAGQIFFSLSVGMGVITTYASYLKKNDDIALSSTTSVAGNEFCEVSLGGMITVPAAFIFFGTAGAVGTTFGLGFKTLPMVFEKMPLGEICGFLFFFLLFLAAITSSLSMLQPVIAFLEEGLNLSRKQSVLLLGIITLLGNALILYYSGGTAAMDAFDFWAGTFCIYLLATFQVILFAWVLGTNKGMQELQRGANLTIPSCFPFVIRYVAPALLIIIFAAWLQDSFMRDLKSYWLPTGGKVAMIFIVACFFLFLIFIRLAVKRWTEQEAQSGGSS